MTENNEINILPLFRLFSSTMMTFAISLPPIQERQSATAPINKRIEDEKRRQKHIPFPIHFYKGIVIFNVL
jgi:hypothetical protein